jgi:hypothetical protein
LLNGAFCNSGGKKRKYEDEGEFPGGFSSCSTTTFVTGSCLILVKKMMTSTKVELMNQNCSGDKDIKIASADLSRTMAANALMLVGDGECFKVVDKV